MSALSICERCLGDALDMVKEIHASDCKICTLAFDVYTFKQSRRSNVVLKTVICHDCADQRNVCQCCILDLKWGITIQERDSLLTMIKGYDIKTPSAQNEMMQRFLTLKNKNNKIGSAKLISDEASTNDLLNQMKKILSKNKSKEISRTSDKLKHKLNNKNLKDVKVDKFTKLFPINETFPLKEVNSSDRKSVPTSFFLYNIDSNLAEWKINDQIARMVNQDHWRDNVPSTMIINHRAQCGGIKFKSIELSEKFIKYINIHNQVVNAINHDGVQRGILKIDQYSLFVVPWPRGFTLNSFGEMKDEYQKISEWIKDKLLINRDKVGGKSDHNWQRSSRSDKKIKKKVKNSKNKRIKTLEL